ncbi:MAG: hypothetical protein PVH61_00110 [Candidatus Aminicenantes bacterium]|jgi:hypothetical protein
MSTEYSVSVHEWNWEDWEFIGRDVMYGFYDENPEEAEKDGNEVEDGKVKCLDEIADYQLPVMLYAYPLDSEPEREKIIEVCRRTNCTVVMKKDTEEYFLALTGGGMDLSQDMALAYIIAQGWIPTALAYAVSTQPELSVSGKDWLKVAERCKKELELAINSNTHKITEWEASIGKFKKVVELSTMKEVKA